MAATFLDLCAKFYVGILVYVCFKSHKHQRQMEWLIKTVVEAGYSCDLSTVLFGESRNKAQDVGPDCAVLLYLH